MTNLEEKIIKERAEKIRKKLFSCENLTDSDFNFMKYRRNEFENIKFKWNKKRYVEKLKVLYEKGLKEN